MGIANDYIVEAAKHFIGQKEIGNNECFEDPIFKQYMIDAGWKSGQAWCAYFAEMVWVNVYRKSLFRDDIASRLEVLFTAGAVATFNNFRKATDFVVSDKPELGAVAIWQTYKSGTPHWTGHAGIVVDIHKDFFNAVEGNTNSQGGREGIEVALKKRTYNFKSTSGLVLRGFIHPVQV